LFLLFLFLNVFWSKNKKEKTNGKAAHKFFGLFLFLRGRVHTACFATILDDLK